MAIEENQRRKIYDRTGGNYDICHKKLAFKNYGMMGARRAWKVEHSRPRSKGGTDHGNNLNASYIPCNRDKSNARTRTARRRSGTTCAPFSKEKKATERRENMAFGAVVGGVLGAAGGPVGLAIGAFVGSDVGKAIKPAKA